VLFWVRSFIEPHLFDHNVLFNNTTPIYLINLPWKLGLDLQLHYFSIFHHRRRNRGGRGGPGPLTFLFEGAQYYRIIDGLV